MNIEITLAPADGSEDNPLLRELLLKITDLMEANKASLKLDVDDAGIQALWLMLVNAGRVSCVVEVSHECL